MQGNECSSTTLENRVLAGDKHSADNNFRNLGNVIDGNE